MTRLLFLLSRVDTVIRNKETVITNKSRMTKKLKSVLSNKKCIFYTGTAQHKKLASSLLFFHTLISQPIPRPTSTNVFINTTELHRFTHIDSKSLGAMREGFSCLL